MACCSCSTFCFIASCLVNLIISCATAEPVTAEPVIIPSNALNATSSNDTATEYVDYHKTTSAKRSGVVTIEYRVKAENETDADEVTKIHLLTKVVVVEILNRQEQGRGKVTPNDTAAGADEGLVRRRRRDAAASYDVELVVVEPPVKDDRLRTSVVATDQDGKVLAAAELESDLKDHKQPIEDKTGYTVVDIYVGLPQDARPVGDSRLTIWQKHFWMFMVVLILLLIALLTALLCCICFYCCRKARKDRKPPPPPQKKEPVEEKIQLTRAAPAQQSAPPSPPMKEEPATMAAPPPHTDDENGWIIPLDQLSQDELDQPDVQISRL